MEKACLTLCWSCHYLWSRVAQDVQRNWVSTPACELSRFRIKGFPFLIATPHLNAVLSSKKICWDWKIVLKVTIKEASVYLKRIFEIPHKKSCLIKTMIFFQNQKSPDFILLSRIILEVEENYTSRWFKWVILYDARANPSNITVFCNYDL